MLGSPLTTIVVAGLGLLLSAVAAAWLRRRVAWRELAARYGGLVERRAATRPGIVFYAASHGELLLLERLLPLLADEQPEIEPIVIVPRLSVERVARERLLHFRVECLCLLAPWLMTMALRRLAADLFVIVEFARIPLWVHAARRLGIPLAIVNGRLSEKNRERCHQWQWLSRPTLRLLDHIFVQAETDAGQFIAAGARPEAIEVTGPLKFDAASYSRNTFATQHLARLARLESSDVVLLAGSTREGEEAILTSIFQRLESSYPQLKLIVVPRNHHRFDEVAALLTSRGIDFRRRTELDSAANEPPARVLLVDTVGELAAWWGTAHIGFVGASLTSRGGQNMIEPAALGVATCFGPHTANFHDVVSLLQAHDAAVEVASEAELEAFVRRCLDQPDYAQERGRRAQAACLANTGAMARTCERLATLVAEPAGPTIVKLPERSTARKARRAA